MKKILACLGLAMAATLSGCTLYFGEEHHHGDGCPPGTYESYDDWGNPVCVPGGPSGYYCSTDNQCASGCYCDETTGTCTEAGFCSTDADCGAGLTCDCSNSCVPAGTETRSCGTTCQETGCPSGMSCANDGTCLPNGPACTDDSVCAAGCYCNTTSGFCEETGICTSNADCPADQHCDTDRSTCVPGAPPPPPPPPTPSCAGTITCSFGAPTCAPGEVPLILDGCYTGACAPLASCTEAPVCAVLNTETNCLGRADCTAVYAGQNCTRPDGSACTMGDTGCTCETFSFDHCRAD